MSSHYRSRRNGNLVCGISRSGDAVQVPGCRTEISGWVGYESSAGTIGFRGYVVAIIDGLDPDWELGLYVENTMLIRIR